MLNWLVENWDNIFTAWGMLVALCTIIVRATPSDKDNKVLETIVKWANVFSVVFTKEDAQVIANAAKKKK